MSAETRYLARVLLRLLRVLTTETPATGHQQLVALRVELARRALEAGLCIA